jgi:hypothetical protein
MEKNLAKWILMLAVGCVLVVSGPAMGTTVWTNAGGDQDFDNLNNWSNGYPAWDVANPAEFNNSFNDAAVLPPTWTSGTIRSDYTGVAGAISFTAPGSYSVPMVIGACMEVRADAENGNYFLGGVDAYGSNTYAAAGSTLTIGLWKGSAIGTGPGKVVLNYPGEVATSAYVGGGTLDVRNSSDTWVASTSYNTSLTGSGTLQNTGGYLTIESGANVTFVGTIDGALNLKNAGQFDFSNITITKSVTDNLFQGRYFARAGDPSGNPSTIKNAIIKANGEIAAYQGALYGYAANSEAAPATIAFDGVNIDSKHLGVTGNVAFTGAVSTLNIKVTGTSAVAGTDYSRFYAQTMREADNSVISANGGILTGLENVELIVDVTPGLDYKGLVMTIVSSANDLTRATTFHKVTFTNNYTGTLTFSGTTPTDGSASWGAVLLSDLNLAAIPGDADRSGLVDQDDYKIWYDNYGTGLTWEQGNFKGYGKTDQDDYKTWYDNYGAGKAGGAVPEPATMALLAMGGLAMLRRRK